MKDSAAEVLQFVRENDVKFIRLAFYDITGSQKNIAIMAQELPRAFERGIGFESPNVLGLERIQHADLFLVPDCSTISILPWRPAHERVMRMYCDVCYADGTPFEDTGRAILQQATQRAADLGYICRVGTECEFYLFRTDENGNPTPRTEKILRATPMGRFGEAEELEGTLLWLTDDKAAGFVTGIVVPVDGGFSAYSGV